MLLGRRSSVSRRLLNVVLATGGVFLLGMIVGFVGSRLGFWDWPPKPSSPFGVALGFLAGAIVAFEMFLWPRKHFHGWRYRFLTARGWVRLHIWVGLVGLPVVVLHSGFGFGGPLSAWTFGLFLAVIASGVYGLLLQQWLPEKIIAEVPSETVASQIDVAIQKHIVEADKIVNEMIDLPAEYDELISGGAAVRVVTARNAPGGGVFSSPTQRLRPMVVGPAKNLLLSFHEQTLKPYLEAGPSARAGLSSRAESRRLFDRLRAGLPENAQPAIDKLESLADLRRQWDHHRRLNFWLHHWLLMHLPLSVAMSVLMVAHAVMALKFW
ncbi:MAG: hypothetical protein ACRCZF_10400 [Gemmataceae bacterium]